MTGGRPCGSVGFLWNKQVPVKVMLVAVDANYKLMAVEVICGDFKLVVVGVYVTLVMMIIIMTL